MTVAVGGSGSPDFGQQQEGQQRPGFATSGGQPDDEAGESDCLVSQVRTGFRSYANPVFGLRCMPGG